MSDTKYSKNQLLKSKKYEKLRDVLQVALQDGTDYTVEEVDERVEAFLARPVVDEKNA